MVNGIDEPWNIRDVSDDILNLVTVGQGNLFPSPYPVNRSFVRTDRNRTYINKGTLANPVWHGLNIAIGEIKTYAGSLNNLPSIGYLLCNGQVVNKITYAELYRVIGNSFGPETATTFTLPDLRNKFARGANTDNDLGEEGGIDTTTLTIEQIPAHGHRFTGFSSERGSLSAVVLPFRVTTYANAETESVGGGQPHENKPPFLDLHYIIAI